MDMNRALQLEWLETNGLGGFASSTVSGANTRRYHGLLTAATKPPVGRYVLLSKLEETLVLADGRRIDLSTNAYHGAVHPEGFRLMTGFRLDPFPISTFTLPAVPLSVTLPIDEMPPAAVTLRAASRSATPPDCTSPLKIGRAHV